MPPNQQEQSAEHKDEHANKEGYKTLWDTWFPDYSLNAGQARLLWRPAGACNGRSQRPPNR